MKIKMEKGGVYLLNNGSIAICESEASHENKLFYRLTNPHDQCGKIWYVKPSGIYAGDTRSHPESVKKRIRP